MAKSVLQALPTYAMQTVNLPKPLCEEIDKVCWVFIRGDSDQGRKIHLIAWENVSRPKQYGGLGVIKARDTKLAFMMGSNWRLCTCNDAIWTSIIRSKYKCGEDMVPRVNKDLPGSNFWK